MERERNDHFNLSRWLYLLQVHALTQGFNGSVNTLIYVRELIFSTMLM